MAMIRYLYSFIFLTTIFTVAGYSLDECIELPPCTVDSLPQNGFSDGSKSHRILSQHYCGFTAGFNMSFSSTNTTLLELPNSPTIKFVIVKYIDYVALRVKIYVPDELWVRTNLVLDDIFSLPGSPFHSSYYGFSRVTLLNCPKKPSGGYGASLICTDYGGNRSSTNTICAVPSERRIEDYVNIDSCTKMFDFDAPPDVVRGTTEWTWSRSRSSCDLSNRRKGVSESTKVIAGSFGGSFLILVLLFAIAYMYPSKEDKENRLKIKKFLDDYISFKPSRYTYADIKKITNKFKDQLGQGTYGTVFKGKLSSDIRVAVKVLNCTKENSEEFINEVIIMGQIHHVNVVRLVGYCADGLRRALVYEFLPNSSLEKYIYTAASNKMKRSIGWDKFQDIAIGIAKGIEYLHQGCGQRILHFDIKPNNILLDRNFNPKISDFGLAKLCSQNQSFVSMTKARGTMGYIAPEVFSINFGNVSCKSDVYSFGMLLLEIVGGRKSNVSSKENDNREIYYPEWIYNLLEDGEDLRIQIEGEGDAKIAKRLAIVGLWCIQWHPIGRPTMKHVVQMLEGNKELTMPPNPFSAIKSTSSPNRNLSARLSPLKLEDIAE